MGATNLTFDITTDSDDIIVSSEGWFSDSGNTLAIGNATAMDSLYHSALRFQNVTIPSGSLIYSAILVLHGTSSITRSSSIQVQFEDTDDANGIVSYADWDGRTLSTGVEWEVTEWDGSNESPDISVEFQTIINKAGWSSGNAVQIFVNSNESISDDANTELNFYARDYAPSASAELEISYGGPGFEKDFPMCSFAAMGNLGLASDFPYISGDFTGIDNSLRLEAEFSVPTFSGTCAQGLEFSGEFPAPTFSGTTGLTANFEVEFENLTGEFVSSAIFEGEFPTLDGNFSGMIHVIGSLDGNFLKSQFAGLIITGIFSEIDKQFPMLQMNSSAVIGNVLSLNGEFSFCETEFTCYNDLTNLNLTGSFSVFTGILYGSTDIDLEDETLKYNRTFDAVGSIIGKLPNMEM